MSIIISIILFILSLLESVISISAIKELGGGASGVIGFLVIMIILCFIVLLIRGCENKKIMIFVEILLSPLAIFRFLIGLIFRIIFKWEFDDFVDGDNVFETVCSYVLFAHPDTCPYSSSGTDLNRNYGTNNYTSNNSINKNLLTNGYSSDLVFAITELANGYYRNDYSGYWNNRIYCTVDSNVSVIQFRITFVINMEYDVDDAAEYAGKNGNCRSTAQNIANYIAKDIVREAKSVIAGTNNKYNENRSYSISTRINVRQRKI